MVVPIGQRQILMTRDHAKAADSDGGAVERAVATPWRHIHQGAVVGVDRAGAQFARRGLSGVGEGRRVGIGKAGGAEAAGQEIVGFTVIVFMQDIAPDEARYVVTGQAKAGAAGSQGGKSNGKRSPEPSGPTVVFHPGHSNRESLNHPS